MKHALYCSNKTSPNTHSFPAKSVYTSACPVLRMFWRSSLFCVVRRFRFVCLDHVQDGLVHHVSVCRSRSDGPVHYAVPKEDVRSNWCLVVEHPSLPERNLVSCLRQDAWIRTVKVCAWGRTVCEGSGEGVSELFQADRSIWYQPRKRRRIRHKHMDETDGG